MKYKGHDIQVYEEIDSKNKKIFVRIIDGFGSFGISATQTTKKEEYEKAKKAIDRYIGYRKSPCLQTAGIKRR